MGIKEEWKTKINGVVHSCHQEIRRTTLLGIKMLSGSKITSELNDCYKELGQLAYRSIHKGEFTWPNAKALKLMQEIERHQKDLQFIECEMNKIKFAAGPEMIREEKSDSDENRPTLH